MEKLIELLNEYDENWKIGKNGLYKHEEYEPMEEYIISKNFGFIKWLVENDKIDREQKTKEFRLQIELDNGSYGELGGEARLLMLLSISDSPTEDLLLYLK